MKTLIVTIEYDDSRCQEVGALLTGLAGQVYALADRYGTLAGLDGVVAFDSRSDCKARVEVKE